MTAGLVVLRGKERPILFSAPMVRAIRAGTKTQTRRVVKDTGLYAIDADIHGMETAARELAHLAARCPYGQPGDRLWVRETHLNWWNNTEPKTFSHVAAFAADGYQLQPGEKWTPSIHMLRAASRITLEITDVRVERLRDISEADALAEGIEEVMAGRWRIYGRDTDGHDMDRSPRVSYCSLWESINGPGSWDANPWVWAVSFRNLALTA